MIELHVLPPGVDVLCITCANNTNEVSELWEPTG